MSTTPVQMIDLVTKEKFDATAKTGLKVVSTKNNRLAWVAPAPTERKNLCYKFAKQADVDAFTQSTGIKPVPKEQLVH